MDVAHARQNPVHTIREAQGVKLQHDIFEMVTVKSRSNACRAISDGVPPGHFRFDDRHAASPDGYQGRPAENKKILTDPQRVLAQRRHPACRGRETGRKLWPPMPLRRQRSPKSSRRARRKPKRAKKKVAPPAEKEKKK